MSKSQFLIGMFIFSLLSPLSSWAKVYGLVHFGYDHDGNDFITVPYDNGRESSITPGSGYLGRVGVGVSFESLRGVLRNFDLQTTIGFKFDGIARATNADLDWTRIPVELLGFYRFEQSSFRLGGGLTYHFANELKGTGITRMNHVFDSALGGVIEGDYRFGVRDQMSVSLRYTMIHYTHDVFSIKANSLGIHAGFFF